MRTAATTSSTTPPEDPMTPCRDQRCSPRRLALGALLVGNLLGSLLTSSIAAALTHWYANRPYCHLALSIVTVTWN